MDAETLWNLVKDWPEAARFEGAYYSSSCRAICDGEGLKMLDHVAAHALTGSGIVWLAKQRNGFPAALHHIEIGDFWVVNPADRVHFLSPLEAISAAILSHLPAKGASNE